MSLRERRLVRRLRNRDEKAFRELVDGYGDRVYRLCLRMLGVTAEAEDVAQEVFISVFKSIDSFRGDSSLSTWLYRIAANHCKNRLKYLARRREEAKQEFAEEETRASLASKPVARSPEQSMQDQELGGRLKEAIDALDEDNRMLIILRDIEELSYEELAAITNLPQGTVKSRLHRARALLRKKLSKGD